MIGRARLLPGQAWHSPGMDLRTWYPVLDGNPEVPTPPLPGWVWIGIVVGLAVVAAGIILGRRRMSDEDRV